MKCAGEVPAARMHSSWDQVPRTALEQYANMLASEQKENTLIVQLSYKTIY